MNNLWSTVKKGMLTLGMLGMSALPYAAAQDAPKPEQKVEQKDAQKPAVKQEEVPYSVRPASVEYARPDSAMPGIDSRIRAAFGNQSGDITGSQYAITGRIEFPDYQFSAAGNTFSQNGKRGKSDSSVDILDDGFGTITTTTLTNALTSKTSRSASSGRVGYAGFGVQVNTSQLKNHEINSSDSAFSDTDGANGFDNFSHEVNGQATNTALIMSYEGKDFSVMAGGAKRKSTNALREYDLFFVDDGGGFVFTDTIEDRLNTKETATEMVLGGTYNVRNDLAVGVALSRSNIDRTVDQFHEETQDGLVTATNSSSVKDSRTPLYIRAHALYAPEQLPFAVSAAIGRMSENRDGDAKMTFDGGVALKLGDSALLYVMGGTDPDGKSFVIPALAFIPREHQQRMHDFARFAADQRVFLRDDTAQSMQYQDVAHGMGAYGWTVGGMVTTEFDGIEQPEIKHYKPFVAGNLNGALSRDPKDWNVILSLVGDITEETMGARFRATADIFKGVGLVGEAGYTLLKKVDTLNTSRPELKSTDYFVGLQYAYQF